MLRTTLASMALMGLASAQSFDYPDFSSITGLVLNGDALQSGATLRVTSSVISEKGSVWYDQPVAVGTGFDTTFTFQITDLVSQGGDGIAFVVQNDPVGTAALADHASAMGYGGFLGSLTNAIDNSLAIEIDTFLGSSWGDPNSNHLSIHTGGVGDNSQHEDFSIGQHLPAVNMSDGAVHTLRVVYDGTNLELYLDDLVTPALSVPYNFGTGGMYLGGAAADGLDLAPGGLAWVGFTAANGGSFENHDVLSWEFSTGGGTLGTSYCVSAGNSVSASGSRIMATGSNSLAVMDLTLIADNAPTQPGLFFFGPDQILVPFGNGFRCVGGQVIRLPIIVGGGGVFAHTVDFGIYGGSIAAMGTANFQCWYRDPVAGGANFNLSDAVEIVFVP